MHPVPFYLSDRRNAAVVFVAALVLAKNKFYIVIEERSSFSLVGCFMSVTRCWSSRYVTVVASFNTSSFESFISNKRKGSSSDDALFRSQYGGDGVGGAFARLRARADRMRDVWVSCRFLLWKRLRCFVDLRWAGKKLHPKSTSMAAEMLLPLH